MRILAAPIILAVGAVILLQTPLNADINKGKKVYLKTCKTCHGDGPKGAAMHTQDEWDELFANNAEQIIKKHIGTKVQPYFEGETFKGETSKDLRDFLHEYGSDSGNVLTCG